LCLPTMTLRFSTLDRMWQLPEHEGDPDRACVDPAEVHA